eukprot:1837677-Pyramimonas_sp.AAC.1
MDTNDGASGGLRLYLLFTSIAFTRPHFLLSNGCKFSSPRKLMSYSGWYTTGSCGVEHEQIHSQVCDTALHSWSPELAIFGPSSEVSRNVPGWTLLLYTVACSQVLCWVTKTKHTLLGQTLSTGGLASSALNPGGGV